MRVLLLMISDMHAARISPINPRITDGMVRRLDSVVSNPRARRDSVK